METQITIIIPLYNAEKYLERCLSSLFRQTCSSFKIILVNDGSMDKTEDICMRYINDDRIEYIRQKNSGSGKARNAGLKIANTSYVTFLDCDDEFPEDTIETYLKWIGKADLIIGNIEKMSNTNVRTYIHEEKKIITREEIAQSIIYDAYLLNPTCCKLFKTKILKENNIFFNNYTYGEDTYFVYSYLMCIESIQFIGKVTYCVHPEQNSLSTKKVPEIWSYMKGLFEKGKKIDEGNKWLEYMLLMRAIKTTLIVKKKEEKENFFRTCEEMQRYIASLNVNTRIITGFYNKIVYKLLYEKFYGVLFFIIAFRLKIGI